MRTRFPLTVICFVVAALLLSRAITTRSGTASGIAGHTLEGSFVLNEILIGLKPEAAARVVGQVTAPNHTGVASLDRLNVQYGVQHVSPVFLDFAGDPIAVKYGLAGVVKLTVPAGTDLFAMIAEYQMDPAIAYAEPNRIYEATRLPKDDDFSRQWALHNTGQTGGTPDADINAPKAWNIERGKPTVQIAIVDTGVDYNHPDLAGRRVRTDIDKDFVNSDDDAMDDHGHGTYVAGIAAASTNNARGIAGVCRGCQILPVKVLDSQGSGTATSVAQGIQYAARAGAKVISMSLGYPSNCGCSQTVARAINYAFERGSLLIAASGNDSDKGRLSYPASSPRVLSVGASDHNDQEAGYSNGGPDLDVIAPGTDVYSLDLNSEFQTASGTSAAAPHVSGVAGLVWSARPHLSNVKVWWILYQSADAFPRTGNTALLESPAGATAETLTAEVGQYKSSLPRLSKMRSTFGRLNAYRALTASIVGRKAASVDTCSGEANCPPGCGLEVTLAGQGTAVADLRLLRTFRDRILADHPVGQAWITLYERHRFEVALILATDGEFRAQARLAVEQWLALIQALADPGSAAEEVLTPEHIEAAEAVMEGLAARGSPQLRSDLEAMRQVLKMEQFVGVDVREVWSALHELKQ